MALTDDKKNVFTTIGAYTSLMQAKTPPEGNNTFSSINNSNEVVPFLIDILKIVVGTTALQQLTGELLTNFITTVEPDMKAGVKKQTIQQNSNEPLPGYFKTNGINVPVKNIDTNGKLKTNPNSETGNLLYDNSKPNFDNTAYQAIQNAGTDTTYNNLVINYNSSTDSFNFKPNLATNSNPTIGDWTSSFIDNTTIVNKKEFMTNVTNSFYGTVTTNQNKSVNEVYNELLLKKLLEQLIAGNDSFVISPEDYDALLRQAQDLVNGTVNYNLGCGSMPANFQLNDMTTLINNISNSVDPHYVGNQLNNTINNSVSDPSINDENKETIKDNFFHRLIEIITLMLATAATTSPQIRTLLAITSAFQNNGVVKIGDPKSDLANFKIYLNCIIKIAMKLINKFIYDLVVVFLIALISPVIKKILKEKINQYIGIIRSLT